MRRRRHGLVRTVGDRHSGIDSTPPASEVAPLSRKKKPQPPRSAEPSNSAPAAFGHPTDCGRLRLQPCTSPRRSFPVSPRSRLAAMPSSLSCRWVARRMVCYSIEAVAHLGPMEFDDDCVVGVRPPSQHQCGRDGSVRQSASRPESALDSRGAHRRIPADPAGVSAAPSMPRSLCDDDRSLGGDCGVRTLPLHCFTLKVMLLRRCS